MSAKAILVIDDDQDILDCLVHAIEQNVANVVVLTASNASEARRVIKLNQIAVVVSDYRLPGMNGIELMQKLKDNLTEMPDYIFLTGFYSKKLNEEAQALGATAVLEKPFTDELFQMLHFRTR